MNFEEFVGLHEAKIDAYIRQSDPSFGLRGETKDELKWQRFKTGAKMLQKGLLPSAYSCSGKRQE